MWMIDLLAAYPWLWLVLVAMVSVSAFCGYQWGLMNGRDRGYAERDEDYDQEMLLRGEVLEPLGALNPPPPSHPVWRNQALKPAGPVSGEGPGPAAPTCRADTETIVMAFMDAELANIAAALPEGWL